MLAKSIVSKKRFLALLQAYETGCAEQRVLLAHGEMEGLAELQSRQASILSALVSAATECGIQPGVDPELDKRLAGLIAEQNHHSAVIEDALRKARVELAGLQSARQGLISYREGCGVDTVSAGRRFASEA